MQKPSSRVIIESVRPCLDSTEHWVKTIVGEDFKVEAVIICDGHEHLRGNLLYRAEKERTWKQLPLQAQGNDIWEASFRPEKMGIYHFTVEASLDHFDKWRHDVKVKIDAGVLNEVDILQGVALFESYLTISSKSLSKVIQEKISQLKHLIEPLNPSEIARFIEDEKLEKISNEIKDPSLIRFPKVLKVFAEPRLAQFSAWYEFFPRSFGDDKNPHGTFATAAQHLDYVADLGFDVIYLPPIHPIGEKNRKGKNNALKAEKNDVGSPWAIGSADGGHKSVHPALGGMKEFEKFVKRCEQLNLQVALDIAFQCSPDHPYLREHPEWFLKRPDGSIQCAENPPKKYEDIYPFDFFNSNYKELWAELKSVFEFWIDKGIKIFRVDNPHTKPFPFWQWLIHEIKQKNPEIIFLSEAFTRPHVMQHLAKLGFTQSYTYFTWRRDKEEMQEYLEELTDPKLSCFYRPNFWPNTPDILSGPLRRGSRNDFQIRLLLAATLSSNYGIYGPSFELIDNTPFSDKNEEYLNSEKYELKSWKLDSPQTLAPVIKKINKIRKDFLALQNTHFVEFHETKNENLIAYSRKATGDSNMILVVINLDPARKQSGLLTFTKEDHGWSATENFLVKDVLNETSYSWQGDSHYIELDPVKTCAHIFSLHVKEKNMQLKTSDGAHG